MRVPFQCPSESYFAFPPTRGGKRQGTEDRQQQDLLLRAHGHGHQRRDAPRRSFSCHISGGVNIEHPLLIAVCPGSQIKRGKSTCEIR